MKRIKLILLAVMLLMLISCTATNRSIQALQKSGFTEISTIGWNPLSCSQDDFFSTAFRAKNNLGVIVEGTVCCGLITKGCTIRF